MISDEVASALAPFFDQIGPSHDELTTLIHRAGLSKLDPAPGSTTPIGKMRRVRSVLYEAAQYEPHSAERLVKALIDAARASGSFRLGNENYAGHAHIVSLRVALKNVGYHLEDDGTVHPTQLEALEGRELTEALKAYVRRARLGAWDPATVLGTGKSLEEATARYILKERTNAYPVYADFPTTLYQAFLSVGLSTPDRKVLNAIPGDPRQALHQAVWLLGAAVNRFRNAEGEGHGRPEVPKTTQAEASIVGLAVAIVTELLLEAHETGFGNHSF